MNIFKFWKKTESGSLDNAEKELLYQGLDWYVGVDGVYSSAKEEPLTNRLYELALAFSNANEQVKAKSQIIADSSEKISSLNSENSELQKELSSVKEKCQTLEYKVHDLRQLRELDADARVRLTEQLNKYEEYIKRLKKTLSSELSTVENE